MESIRGRFDGFEVNAKTIRELFEKYLAAGADAPPDWWLTAARLLHSIDVSKGEVASVFGEVGRGD